MKRHIAINVVHLTTKQHAEAARLLREAIDNIDRVCRIVQRSPFTDRALYVMGTVEEWLVDPLRADWESRPESRETHQIILRQPLYCRTDYAGPYKRRPPPGGVAPL